MATKTAGLIVTAEPLMFSQTPPTLHLSQPLACFLKDSLYSIFIRDSFHLSGSTEHLHVVPNHWPEEHSIFNEKNLVVKSLVIEVQAETGLWIRQGEIPWKSWARSTMLPRPQRGWHWERSHVETLQGVSPGIECTDSVPVLPGDTVASFKGSSFLVLLAT